MMETDPRSWHSVNPVLKADRRCCVSNYYFSAVSPAGRDYRHVTSFKGRPGQEARTLVLRLDAMARNVLGRFLSNRALEAIRKVVYRRRA